MSQDRFTTRRAYGYLLLSTQEEAQGLSLDAQENRLRAYCLARHMELVAIFREEACGTIPLADRSQGKLLLATLEPGDAVVVVRLDRLFCSKRDALNSLQNWGDAHIALHSLDIGGQLPELFLPLLAELVQMERDYLSERTRAGLAQRKLTMQQMGIEELPRGNWGAADPAACIIKRMRRALEDRAVNTPEDLAALQEEARLAAKSAEETIELVYHLAMRGNNGIPMSQADIARYLNNVGIPPLGRAQKWHRSTIWELLARHPRRRTTIRDASGKRRTVPLKDWQATKQRVKRGRKW